MELTFAGAAQTVTGSQHLLRINGHRLLLECGLFQERYSPYQNVRKEGRYPRLFLVTSTRDDRVHPGHARKMAARMLEQGHDVLYFENIEGGHGAAANNEQAARMWAQTYTFLWHQLSSP